MELAKAKQKVEELRALYSTYREKIIHDAINALNPKEKEKLMTDFYALAEPAIATILQFQRKKYTRENVMDSPQMKAILRQFALRELDFLALASLDEFVAQQAEENRSAWQKLKSYDPDHPLLRFSE